MRVFAILILLLIAISYLWMRFGYGRRKISLARARRELYKQLDQRASAGDQEAMYRLAKLFYKEKDAQYYPLIFKWVQILATQKKDPAVWLMLADLLANGCGTDKDLQRALSCYEQALAFDIAASRDTHLSLKAHNYLEQQIVLLRCKLGLQD